MRCDLNYRRSSGTTVRVAPRSMAEGKRSMPTRSVRLATSLSGGPSGGVLAVVPANTTWIVKSVVMFNKGAGPAIVAFVVGDSIAFARLKILKATLAVDDFAIWNGWVVLRPTDQIEFETNLAGTAVWVSGAKLPGVG